MHVLSQFSGVWLSATPMDCSPAGSPVHGILQARIVEWISISFSMVRKTHGKLGLCTVPPSGRRKPHIPRERRFEPNCSLWASRALVLINKYPAFTLDNFPWILLYFIWSSKQCFQVGIDQSLFSVLACGTACFSFTPPFLIMGIRDIRCSDTGVGFRFYWLSNGSVGDCFCFHLKRQRKTQAQPQRGLGSHSWLL